LNETLKSLIEEELTIRGKSHFKEFEEKWQDFWEKNKNSSKDVLVEYNRFRLRNLHRSKVKRPAALLGFINDFHFPNFQTYGLLKVADVISLFCQGNQTSEKKNSTSEDVDRVCFDLVQDDIHSILKKLPKGFKPDLFWDSQAAHGHVHPKGLTQAPFPSFAGICHVHSGPAVKSVCELFDFVLPVGECFSDSLSYGSAQVLNLPFGLNWASFEFDKENDQENRDIDVSITFSKTDDLVYGNLRNLVVSELQEIKNRNSSLSILIESGLDKVKYLEVLKRSKISLNVVGLNGPYNYRTCEIINSGALLFQINHCEDGISLNAEENFQDGEDFVLFSLVHLETKILHYLDNIEDRERISRSANQKLENEYTYENGFLSLIKNSKDFSRPELKTEEDLKPGFMNGVFMWQQFNKPDTRLLGAAVIGTHLSEFNDLKFYGNLLAVFPELLKSLGPDFIKNLIAKKNHELATKLDFKNPMQVAVDIYSQSMDNAAMCYNFISLALEFGWANLQQLSQIAEQAFNGFLFPDYNRFWLLRSCYNMNGQSTSELSNIRYQTFDLKILSADNLQSEWIAYRDYILTLCKLGASQPVNV